MELLQYSFALDDDFNMQTIRSRIAEKRHLLDGLAGMRWKAWLLSEPKVGMDQPKSYAPLYLFDATPPLVSFLAGPIYKGVTDAFGWTVPFQGPSLAQPSPDIMGVKACTLHICPVRTHADLVAAFEKSKVRLQAETTRVSMFDISRMCLRTFVFHSEAAEAIPVGDASLIYDVVALSGPTPAS